MLRYYSFHFILSTNNCCRTFTHCIHQHPPFNYWIEQYSKTPFFHVKIKHVISLNIFRCTMSSLNDNAIIKQTEVCVECTLVVLQVECDDGLKRNCSFTIQKLYEIACKTWINGQRFMYSLSQWKFMKKKINERKFHNSTFFACVSAIGVICRSLSYIWPKHTVLFVYTFISLIALYRSRKLLVFICYSTHKADDSNNNDGDDDAMSGHRMSNSGAFVVSFLVICCGTLFLYHFY